MRKLGLFPKAKLIKKYKAKPYEAMTHAGERIQVDVKVVPRRCMADPTLKLYQYTAIDEYSRLCFLGVTLSRVLTRPMISSSTLSNGSGGERCWWNVYRPTTVLSLPTAS